MKLQLRVWVRHNDMLSAISLDRFILPDEAEGIIVMVSEWLELDAADDWVRHDAEIVCVA